MRTATIATALLALCAAFPVCGAELPPVASETGRVTPGMVDRTTRCAIGRFKKCDIQIAVAHGLFETGLRPRFPEGVECRDVDEGYAIAYGFKRDRESYHSGIDMPAPTGTPVIAAATGTVVGKFEGERSNRGIEVVLRHAPEDTGFPYWIYTHYTHFSKMPELELGQRVRMGEVLGPTGNSGVRSDKRRPAVHFGAVYSPDARYTEVRNVIVPFDGRWMDPIALYRLAPPFDSATLKDLPVADKQVPIAVMLEDGTTIPANARIIWPYRCARRR